MKAPELKVPPPIVGLACAVMMSLLTWFMPLTRVAPRFRVGIAIAIIAAGVTISLAGFVTVRKAETTVDPTDLSRAVALVTRGIYLSLPKNPSGAGLAP